MDNTLTKAAGGGNKILWAVIAALGIAVLAMGAMLLRTQGSGAHDTVAAVTAPAASASSTGTNTDSKAAPSAEKPAAASVAPAAKAPVKQKATAPAHTAVPQPIPSTAPEPAVLHAPPPAEPVKTICANCGVVERVTPIEQEGAGSGVGAIAGGVLGALVGNQIGGGSGKSLATVAGAIGGGIAGNTVEKKMNKVTRYEVLVRMENGSTRTLTQTTPLAAGTHVIVDGNSLRSAAPQ